MSQTIEGLYPLLILIGATILKGLHKKAKEKKEKEKRVLHPAPHPPERFSEVKPPPPVVLKKPKPLELPKTVEKDIFQRGKKPRIGRLIANLKNKKNLVLLSEILVNKRDLY